MKKTLLALSLSFLAACTASTSPDTDEETSSTEEELRSAECPPAVDVLLHKPSIASNARLLSAWENDLDYESDPQAAAEEQMTRLTSHVAKARAQNAVKLHGTIGRACSYKTVDAQTGEPNGYRFWFARSGASTNTNGQLQIRIERDLGTPDHALFFSAPLTSVSRTSVAVDSSRTGRVQAQIHESGYHGEPDGPNAWIGSVKVTITLSQ